MAEQLNAGEIYRRLAAASQQDTLEVGASTEPWVPAHRAEASNVSARMEAQQAETPSAASPSTLGPDVSPPFSRHPGLVKRGSVRITSPAWLIARGRKLVQDRDAYLHAARGQFAAVKTRQTELAMAMRFLREIKGEHAEAIEKSGPRKINAKAVAELEQEMGRARQRVELCRTEFEEFSRQHAKIMRNLDLARAAVAGFRSIVKDADGIIAQAEGSA